MSPTTAVSTTTHPTIADALDEYIKAFLFFKPTEYQLIRINERIFGYKMEKEIRDGEMDEDDELQYEAFVCRYSDDDDKKRFFKLIRYGDSPTFREIEIATNQMNEDREMFMSCIVGDA